MLEARSICDMKYACVTCKKASGTGVESGRVHSSDVSLV